MAASSETAKFEKLFNAYISPRRVLIADECAAARAGLAKALIDLGAQANNIALCSSFALAEDEMNRVRPHVVLCDYDIGRGSGLTLLQSQRKSRPEAKDSLFILVTGNTSQSAVAQAAEEDIDTYVIKPYTLETLRQSIVKAAISKVYPSDYVKAIEAGKQLLFAGKGTEAEEVFQRAMTLNPKPTLACFYLGQAALLKQALEQAEGKYNEGLGYNKIHYKCLVGLYDLLMSKTMYAAAYDVVKRISRYFPANPQRLASVLRLAIMTKSYDDIEAYYRVFTGLDQRNEEITKYICAALVVCGKYYLQKDMPSRALELFGKAATSSAGRTKVLREIIVTLAEFNLNKDAQEFLAKFPPGARSESDFLAMEYLVSDRFISLSRSIDLGRKLLKRGIDDPVVYRVLLPRTIEAGLGDMADTLLRDACVRWPQQAQDFQGISSAALRGKGAKDE